MALSSSITITDSYEIKTSLGVWGKNTTIYSSILLIIKTSFILLQFFVS
jgi:hypothetical protein